MPLCLTKNDPNAPDISTHVLSVWTEKEVYEAEPTIGKDRSQDRFYIQLPCTEKSLMIVCFIRRDVRKHRKGTMKKNMKLESRHACRAKILLSAQDAFNFLSTPFSIWSRRQPLTCRGRIKPHSCHKFVLVTSPSAFCKSVQTTVFRLLLLVVEAVMSDNRLVGQQSQVGDANTTITLC
jgi:hypothetical protein